MPRPDITFIAHETAGTENLPPRLLAGAVERAGFNATVVTAPDRSSGSRVLEDALASNPRALGFYLKYPSTSLLELGLGLMARRRGYRGFVFCVGPMATLQTSWILRKVAAIDGVIRFSAEQALVELARRLRMDAPVDDVPSLTTRERSNPVPPVDAEPCWRPLRSERPTIHGVPLAKVITARGCQYRCDYCIHAAMARTRKREAARREPDPTSPHCTRHRGIRRRPIADLADEMAVLYHDDSVRYFFVPDENPLPPNEQSALDWIGEIKGALAAREVEDVALGMKIRGDRLTPAVADALVDLGLVRALSGIESATPEGLAGIGRKADPRAAIAGMRMLAERGVVTLFNSMILNPDSTPESIGAELEFLSSVEGALFKTIKVRPYSGTAIRRRMRRDGRLEGGELMPAYRFDDPVVARFNGLLTHLETRVLGATDPFFKTLDLLLSARLAQRFGSPAGSLGPADRELSRLVRQVNGARVMTLRVLLDCAIEQRLPIDLFERITDRFARIDDELERACRELERETHRPVDRHFRQVAAAAVIAFAVSTGAACHRVGPDRANAPDDPFEDAGVKPDGGVDTETESDTDSGSDTDTAACTDWETTEDWEQLFALVTGNCGYWDHYAEVLVNIGDDGVMESVELPNESADEPWVQEMIDCYEELLAGEEFPCLAGEEVWVIPWIPE